MAWIISRNCVYMPVHCLLGEGIIVQCFMGRDKLVMTDGSMFCWVTTGPDHHLDFTLNLLDHCFRLHNPPLWQWYTRAVVPVNRIMHCARLEKFLWNALKRQDKMFMVLNYPSRSPDSILSNFCGILRGIHSTPQMNKCSHSGVHLDNHVSYKDRRLAPT